MKYGANESFSRQNLSRHRNRNENSIRAHSMNDKSCCRQCMREISGIRDQKK